MFLARNPVDDTQCATSDMDESRACRCEEQQLAQQQEAWQMGEVHESRLGDHLTCSRLVRCPNRRRMKQASFLQKPSLAPIQALPLDFLLGETSLPTARVVSKAGLSTNRLLPATSTIPHVPVANSGTPRTSSAQLSSLRLSLARPARDYFLALPLPFNVHSYQQKHNIVVQGESN